MTGQRFLSLALGRPPRRRAGPLHTPRGQPSRHPSEGAPAVAPSRLIELAHEGTLPLDAEGGRSGGSMAKRTSS
jgi:hypothetical protein